MKALVLGGSVFVGRRLVEMLVAAGHEVAVLNRGVTPTQLPDGVGHLVADRTSTASMAAALAGTEWDVVYDVSGFVMTAGGSDIDGLLDLFTGRVGHYVYVSSIMAYEQALVGVMPWVESMPTNSGGATTYGGFKAMVESALARRDGLCWSAVRPAAIYGPYNNIYDMEAPMFLRLAQHRPILVPHGGLVTASYGHVDDLCRFMTAMAGQAVTFGEVFNVTAEAVTTRRYVDELAAIVGVEPDVVMVPDALLAQMPAGVWGHLFSARHHAVLSYAKAHAAIDCSADLSFVDGHAATFDWFRSQGLDRLDGPLADPVWRATWDFDAEARAVDMIRASQ